MTPKSVAFRLGGAIAAASIGTAVSAFVTAANSGMAQTADRAHDAAVELDQSQGLIAPGDRQI